MGWMNGSEEGYEPAFTRIAEHLKLRPATNRNTECYWVTILGVDVLFSYRTAMAFNKPGEGSFRRKGDISRTTRNHLHETRTHCWNELDDAEFERKLGAAIVGQFLRTKELVDMIVGEVAAQKLTAEA